MALKNVVNDFKEGIMNLERQRTAARERMEQADKERKEALSTLCRINAKSMDNQTREFDRCLRIIVQKLIGPVQPTGSTHVDDKRLENLHTMITLMDELISNLEIVAAMRHSKEHSIKQAGDAAANYLDELELISHK